MYEVHQVDVMKLRYKPWLLRIFFMGIEVNVLESISIKLFEHISKIFRKHRFKKLMVEIHYVTI